NGSSAKNVLLAYFITVNTFNKRNCIQVFITAHIVLKLPAGREQQHIAISQGNIADPATQPPTIAVNRYNGRIKTHPEIGVLYLMPGQIRSDRNQHLYHFKSIR